MRFQPRGGAWISVSTATDARAWVLQDREQNRARWIKAGEAFTLTGIVGTEVKVRVEVKQNADCSGATTTDTYSIGRGPTKAGQVLTAGLFPDGKRFLVLVR